MKDYHINISHKMKLSRNIKFIICNKSPNKSIQPRPRIADRFFVRASRRAADLGVSLIIITNHRLVKERTVGNINRT